MSTGTETVLGTHSEVGKLRRVMIHRPDLELKRLTPGNHDELLFDDVLWVRRARQQHDAFADLLRDRGVEVLYLEELLAETLAAADARKWVLARRVRPRRSRRFARAADGAAAREAGPRTWRPPHRRHDARSELPGEAAVGRSAGALRPDDFVLPPLPNQLFTRDTSAWIYGGVSVNPMYWPARRLETLNVEAVYRFHRASATPASSSGSRRRRRLGHRPRLEGGDIMPIGNGVVLIGMGERTTARGGEHLARTCSRPGAADRVIARADVARPRAHAPRHGVHLLRPRRRDAVPPVVDSIPPILGHARRRRRRRRRPRPERLVPRRDQGRARAQGPARHRHRRRRLAGRARAVGRRQQRRRPRAGRRRRLRAQRVHQRRCCARPGIEVHHRRRRRARPRPRRRPLHDLPDRSAIA